MFDRTRITIPSLVRIKAGALDRLGLYLSREKFQRVAMFTSSGLDPTLPARAMSGFAGKRVELQRHIEVRNAGFEHAVEYFEQLPGSCQALIGLGGGKALDVAKYVAYLAQKPCFAVPTSLSNDGFCSPQSSLTLGGRRRSLPSTMPYAVVVDTAVCLGAPDPLWWSGVGDLVCKVTAIVDWKMAYHAAGTPVNDFAALLSDATVFQFMAAPRRDLEGVRLLATALMLNGIAMEICGSSRPASGSEHLISHALDVISKRPRLHGLQVGVAAYVVSRLQGGAGTERIAHVLDATGFWRGIQADPFSRDEWLEAARLAPTLKDDFYTVLSSRDCLPKIESILREDPLLTPCFVQ